MDTNSTAASNNATIETLSYVETIIFGAIFTVIGCVGIVGNSLVIMAVACDAKMRRSAMNVLLLNLAVADLCNLIVCVPEITFALMKQGWLSPWPTCQLLRYLEVLFLYTSLLTQVAVCIERFVAISIPMKIKLLCSKRKVQVWATVLWSIAAASASPYVLFHQLVNGNMCVLQMEPFYFMAFKCVECLSFYFVPLVLIVVLYARISLILWSSNAQLHEGVQQTGKDNGQVNETLRTRQNVVKMLIACVFVYFVCYSPIQAIFVAALFGLRFQPPFALRLVLNCMAYGCSAANPLLYSIFSRKFRARFAELLKCSAKRHPSSATPRSGYQYVPATMSRCYPSANTIADDGRQKQRRPSPIGVYSKIDNNCDSGTCI